MSWAAEELKGVDLGDKRRNQRLITIVEDLSAQPNESVTQASRDAAAVQGVYEFWANPRIKAEAIISSHAKSTVERIKEHRTILAIQDTTELDFSDHKSKRGMGPLSNPEAKGLKVHTVLAASTEGVPLGVLHQKVWSREKTRSNASKQKRQAIENKESIRWLEGLDLTQGLMPALTTVITVADREADIWDLQKIKCPALSNIFRLNPRTGGRCAPRRNARAGHFIIWKCLYQLFALARQRNSEFLIRAAQNRNTKSNAFCDEVVPLFEAIRTTPVLGKLTLELQRTPRRAARSATLSVRVTKLWLQPPASLQSQSTQAIEVHVIEACEENPPEGEKAISWLLLTTIEVKNFELACQCLEWYSYRWLIERYHYCLKSGCRIEQLQLEDGERIKRALATYAIVAWRLLWLTYEARRNPERTVEGILETHEWQALYCKIHKTNKPPSEAPSLGECVRWIARLGGFLGRKSDGDPGIQTLWRGFQRLNDIAGIWQLLYQGDF